MPWVDYDTPGPVGEFGAPAVVPEPPSPRAVSDAGWARENEVASLVKAMGRSRQFTDVPGHNPLDTIRGTPFAERYLDRFEGSMSPEQDRAIMAQITEEEKNDQILDAAGWLGTLSRVTAGLTSPTVFLPGGTFYRAARGGFSIARTAASVGAAAGVQVGVQEALMQTTQLTRPLSESAMNIGTATLFGAIIGGGGARLLSGAERKTFIGALERERAATDAHVQGVPVEDVLRQRVAEDEAAIPANVNEKPISITMRVTDDMTDEATGRRNLVFRGSDETGTDRVHALVEIDGTTASLNDIRALDAEGREMSEDASRNILGPKMMRSVLKQFRETFPEVDKIIADRVSGARTGGVYDIMKGQEIEVPLRSANDDAPLAPVRAADAGAAATDTRELEPVGFGLNKIPGWSRIARFIGTDLGIYSSQSTEAKRLFSETASTTLRFKQNIPKDIIDPVTGEKVGETVGDVTSPVVPLDQEVRLRMEQAQIATRDELTRLYSRYFFGEDNATAPILRGEIATRFGESGGKLSPAEFDAEIITAMNKGDTHAIPEVQEAAQFLRREILDPYANKMEAANPNFKKQEFKEGESYFPYNWDSPKIAANRPEFVADLTEHLKADQAVKAAAKDRMRALADDLRAAETAVERAASEDVAMVARLQVIELRARLENEIAAWEGKSVAEAKAAIRAREQYAADAPRAEAAPRLKAADDAIDRTVKKIIESDRDLSDIELRDKAEEITDHVLGTPIGRFPYDIAQTANEAPRSADRTARGPLMARDFAIPYDLAKNWLSHDLNRSIGNWLRTMIPDTALWERFPGEGPAMTSRYRAIQEEYAGLVSAAKSAKERTRLNKEKDNVIATIDGVVQRIRGTANNTIGMSGRIGENVRRINQITDLGFAAFTSIPDFAGPVLYHGLMNVFSDGWAPYASYLAGSPDLVRMSKQELRAAGIATEIENTSRGNAIAETSQVYHPQTKAERALKWGSDRFFLLNLQAQETNAAKRIAGRVAGNAFLHAIEAEAAGKATAKQALLLRESNITPELSRRIWDQFNGEGGGATIDGTYLPNTDRWVDETAKMHYLAALMRDVERAVVTPGQEKPLWLSTNAGALLAQYKGFTIAATNKLLISGLQRHDAATLQGVLVSVALGVLSYRLTTLLRGQPWPERPQDVIKEGLNRSGITAGLEEVNMFAAKLSGGTVDMHRLYGADKPLSRNANRTILSTVLGPTAGKIENINRVTSAVGRGDWNEGDTHALRRLIALQNVWGLNSAFDAAERGFNNAFGIRIRPWPGP